MSYRFSFYSEWNFNDSHWKGFKFLHKIIFCLQTWMEIFPLERTSWDWYWGGKVEGCSHYFLINATMEQAEIFTHYSTCIYVCVYPSVMHLPNNYQSCTSSSIKLWQYQHFVVHCDVFALLSCSMCSLLVVNKWNSVTWDIRQKHLIRILPWARWLHCSS